MKTEKYRLFVAPFNSETAKAALDEPYARATNTHVLIYKKGKRPEGYKEMTDADLHFLPQKDKKWLKEVNMIIMQRFLMENQEKANEANAKFFEEFEKELEKEREALSKQGSDTE